MAKTLKNKIQIYMGWDSREIAAYEVARESIRKHCSTPLNILPLKLNHLDGILTRPIENRDGKMWCPISNAPMSTEFAVSRFCVPFLQENGFALFCDCDILCFEDINNLFDLADPQYAVQVVWHDQERADSMKIEPYTNGELKMDGQLQTYYNRKNWSSVILWNCDHPANKKFVTSNMLNTLPGRDLHRFCWLENEEIGELPQKWNFLINVSPGEPELEGIWHFTLGGPWFKRSRLDKYDEIWLQESGAEIYECVS